MKRQKSATFSKNISNVNAIMIKNILTLKNNCHYTGKYRGAAYNISN